MLIFDIYQALEKQTSMQVEAMDSRGKNIVARHDAAIIKSFEAQRIQNDQEKYDAIDKILLEIIAAQVLFRSYMAEREKDPMLRAQCITAYPIEPARPSKERYATYSNEPCLRHCMLTWSIFYLEVSNKCSYESNSAMKLMSFMCHHLVWENSNQSLGLQESSASSR